MRADLCRIRDEFEAFRRNESREVRELRHVGCSTSASGLKDALSRQQGRENIGVNRQQLCRLTPIRLAFTPGTVQLLLFVLTKAEQIHQVSDRWTIQRNVRVALAGYGIREIVAAASRHRS